VKAQDFGGTLKLRRYAWRKKKRLSSGGERNRETRTETQGAGVFGTISARISGVPMKEKVWRGWLRENVPKNLLAWRGATGRSSTIGELAVSREVGQKKKKREETGELKS